MAKRNGSQGGALDPALSQKKRARRRLIGAAAIALAAAIVLPLVLDSEPRQQPPDVEVEIPSRDTPLRPPPAADVAKPAEPVAALPAGPSATQGGSPAETGQPSAKPDSAAKPAPAASGAQTPLAATAPAAGTAPAPARSSSPAKSAAEPAKGAAPAAGSASAPASTPASGATAVQPAPRAPAESSARFVLQIGAYANPESAQSMMERARKAGVRAYTEPVTTAAGTRTRVRVGPFADRESAERARGKLKLVGIDSSVVSLP